MAIIYGFITIIFSFVLYHLCNAIASAYVFGLADAHEMVIFMICCAKSVFDLFLYSKEMKDKDLIVVVMKN